MNNDDLDVVATGVGQICFYHELNPDEPLLSIGFCRDGFWTIPVSLVGECAVLARAANFRLGFFGSASEERVATVSIVYQAGDHIRDYSFTAAGNAPAALSRFLCVVGDVVPTDLHGLLGCFVASDWNAALAPVRLFVQAPGLIGIDLADAIRVMSNRVTWCEAWRLDEQPSTRAAHSEAVWLGFSNRLLLDEVDKAARAVAAALPEATELSFHAGAETMPTMQVDAMLSAPFSVAQQKVEIAE